MHHLQKAPDGKPGPAGLSTLRRRAFLVGLKTQVTRYQKYLVFQLFSSQNSEAAPSSQSRSPPFPPG